MSELGAVREELGAERARRQTAEERVADFEADVADLEAELEVYSGERVPWQTVEEATDLESRSAVGRSSREGARPRSWWRRRIGSIVGVCLVLILGSLAGFVVMTLLLK